MTSNSFKVNKPASVTSAKEAAIQPSNNLPDERLVGMTFNMPKEWHTKFKMTALTEDISMRDLLFRCFDVYLRSKNIK